MNRQKNKTRRAAALVAALLLAGCATGQDATVSCPETGLIQDAAEIAVFRDGAAGGFENVVAQARFANFSGGCLYRDGQLEFTLDLDIAGAQGPAGMERKRHDFPYFVAILGPEEKVLQRQSFSTTVSFDNTPAAPVDATRTVAVRPGKSGTKTERHNLRLPVADREDIRAHKVVIGFALTPEQLAFNRGAAAAQPQEKP